MNFVQGPPVSPLAIGAFHKLTSSAQDATLQAGPDGGQEIGRGDF